MRKRFTIKALELFKPLSQRFGERGREAVQKVQQEGQEASNKQGAGREHSGWDGFYSMFAFLWRKKGIRLRQEEDLQLISPTCFSTELQGRANPHKKTLHMWEVTFHRSCISVTIFSTKDIAETSREKSYSFWKKKVLKDGVEKHNTFFKTSSSWLMKGGGKQKNI